MQMNDTMRTLTIFTAILLPLTLITGIYGMNGLDLADVSNIPTGFAIVVITMIVMAALLFWVFKQKQWIMSNNDDENIYKIKQANKENKYNDSNAS
jgi:magnesium transporter